MAKKRTTGRRAKATSERTTTKPNSRRTTAPSESAEAPGAGMEEVSLAVNATTQHTCMGYTLTIANSNEACRFDLNVDGDDGQQYFLRVKDPADRPDVVKAALTTIAKYWPEYNWHFCADANGRITAIS